MACLIEAWKHIHHSPPSPSASSHPAGCIREIKFALLSEQFVAGDEQHRLSLHGVNPISSEHRLFSLAALLCSWCCFCACHPPPTRRLCARPVGGGPVRRLLYCAGLSSFPAAWRVGRATRSFDFFWKISVVRYHYKMFICVHSCKDAFSFSRRLSLSISSSSLDRCIV